MTNRTITTAEAVATLTIRERIAFPEGEVIDTTAGTMGKPRSINIDHITIALTARASNGQWPDEWDQPSYYGTRGTGRYVKNDGTPGLQETSYAVVAQPVFDELRADMIARWGTPAEAFAKVGA